MNPGTLVRLKSDPGRNGMISGKSRKRGNRSFWQIIFPDGSQYISENQLEVIREEVEDALDLFSQGKFGRARDLRGAITHIRLSGRLADLIYSMETTNTDFYPYQFKPVLNFLDSPSGGILIADEVGLGKTIEAGLIWTELRSRYDARRLMVLCPAMLREKWKTELQLRFGINARVVDTHEALETLVDYRAGNINEFAIVGSMQGLRPNRGWEEDDEIVHKNAVKLARFLNDNAHEDALMDLLIVDEAHYLRNPSSMTSKLGRLLREVTDHVVLLSATPIHLKNEDLFNLLNLVDEDSFNEKNVFDDILQANAPLLKARDMILHEDVNVNEFIEELEEAGSHFLLANNRQLQTLLNAPPTITDIKDTSYRSRLAHRLESINLLGRTVTRTRKREVTEWRVVREAVAETIDLTPAEMEVYTKVTEIVRQYCLENDAHEGFLLVTPQRQIASSMPAALREWQKRQFESDLSYEDIGEDTGQSKEPGPLVQTIIDNADELGDIDELWENDSKYKRFSTELKKFFNDHPKEKVVVFAYFRPTLYYLNERLSSDGIESIVLVGGGTMDKYEVMETFKDPKGPSVLLASEVASEGVDLQFSRVLVNYDLPWNPMKVEQRIGRIDRLGQPSPKITIWNMFYADTIDARIYDRLYLRLGIFEYALGGLEAVLGEEIKNLTIDLLSGNLSPIQEDERISQTQQALSYLIDEEKRLEKNAKNLIAHGDYILNQVRAARELGRCVTGEDLWGYIRDYFNTNYPGCEFRQLEAEELVFEIRLSEKARFDFDRFIQTNQLTGKTNITSLSHKPVRYRFENRVPQRGGRIRDEYINQFHPLTRFVSTMIQEKISQSEVVHFPSLGLQLNKNLTPGLESGDYLFYVERWTVQGIRDIERMVYFARPATENSSFLGDDEAEQLVTNVAKYGKDWLSVGNEVDPSEFVPLVEACMDRAEEQYKEYIVYLTNENNDRADLQEKTLNLHMERQRSKLVEILLNHERKGNVKMIAPTKGKIDKLEARVRDKIREIDQRRKLQHHNKEICIGIVRVQ